MSKIFAESVLLIILRLALFFTCRKYLLHSLFSDLQGLSSERLGAPPDSETPTRTGYSSAPHDSSGDAGIELGTLPAPSTHATKSNRNLFSGKTSFHSAVARTTFAVCFSESCTLFILLMCQGLDIFTPRTRLFNWRFSIFLLLATILVLIPLFVSLVLTVRSTSSTDQGPRKRMLMPRVILSLVPVALYLFALSYIPLPAALSSSDVMTAAFSRLVVLGTIILGLLSGFGAVSNAWAFFPLFSQTRADPTEHEITTAEHALSRIRNDLQDQRETARRRAESQTEGTWFSRVMPALGGDSNLQELKGLEALEYQMSRNLEALRQRHEDVKFSGTIKGKIFNYGGRVFAVYCVVRVISSIINILSPTQSSTSTTTYPDLITHLLAYILSQISPDNVTPEDVALISRHISLALVGIIILTSIRLVLRGATRALRITSRNVGVSLMLLLLAELMGIYLLSTVVQLRTSFPPPPRKPDEDSVIVNLFSTIPEYEVFGSLFDWSFLFAAGASAFVRWGAEKVTGLGNS